MGVALSYGEIQDDDDRWIDDERAVRMRRVSRRGQQVTRGWRLNTRTTDPRTGQKFVKNHRDDRAGARATRTAKSIASIRRLRGTLQAIDIGVHQDVEGFDIRRIRLHSATS